MIATSDPVYTAIRMPAKVLATRLAAGSAARTATAILAKASKDADARTAAARAEAETLRTEARAAAEAECASLLQAAQEACKHLHEQTLQDARIKAVHTVIATAARLEQRFDDLTPWLEALIRDAVTRLVGTLKPTVLHRRIVAEALRDARPVGQLRLRIHPDAAREVGARLGPDDAIAEVISDPTLDRGSCLLDCSTGLMDLSIEAQLDVVLCEISLAARGQAT